MPTKKSASDFAFKPDMKADQPKQISSKSVPKKAIAKGVAVKKATGRMRRG